MSAASAYLENLLMNHVLGQAAIPAISEVFFALFTAAPSDTGGGTEVSGGSYARIGVTNNTVNFATTANGTKLNAGAVTFPESTAGWGTVTHWGIFSAITGGNLLFHGPLNASVAVASADTVSFPSGSFTITMD